MMKVKMSDVARRVNIHVDQENTSLEYYIGGEHIDSSEFMVRRRAKIKGSTIGYQFQFGFKAGHILFMTKNPHLRKTSMVDFDGLCSIATFVLESCDENVLLQKYLLIEMQSDRFWNYCEEHKSGSVNYFINWGTLADYEFELPPLARQKELAELLWAANDLKESYKKMIAATDEMLKAKFREFVHEASIQTIAFGDLCESLDGRRVPVKSGDRKPGPYPYYGASGIVDYVESFIFDEDILLVSVDGANLTARVTPIAFSVTGKCWVNNHAHVVRFKEMYTQKFVEYYLENTDLSMYITGTAQPKLNKEKLNAIPVPLPSDTCQQEFVEIARKADAAKAALKKSIADVDAVIKGLVNG